MLLSKNEMAGFGIAALVIIGMGYLAFHGPFHNINKPAIAAGPPVHVQIVTNPTTVGQYIPAKVTVHVGQPVIWSNVSNADHTVTDHDTPERFDSRNIGTGGQTWEYIPTTPGTFHYICSYHPFMHGILVVLK